MSTKSLFESYEESYRKISLSLSDSITGLNGLSADEKRQKIPSLEKQVKEGEQILQRLDMEARTAATGDSRLLLQKVKDFKSDLKTLRESLATSSRSAAADAQARAELGLADSYYQTSAGQRERLLSATDRLHKTSDRIQHGRQQLLQAESAGTAVLEQLAQQRAALERSKRAATEIDASLSNAETSTRKMQQWWWPF